MHFSERNCNGQYGYGKISNCKKWPSLMNLSSTGSDPHEYDWPRRSSDYQRFD